MRFSFHNKIKVKLNDKTYEFYNTVLSSLLDKLSLFESYTNYLAIGDGSDNLSPIANCKLSKYLTKTAVISKQIQSNIENGNLFATLEFKFNRADILGNYIKEAGLCENYTNPIIYNYITFISGETPNGIDISSANEIVMELTIYLNITENNGILLTSGNNKFIEFLLGEGLGDVYISSGTNYAENTRLSRTVAPNQTKYLCRKIANIQEETLSIEFTSKLKIGEINEILFITKNEVFARKNVREFNATTNSETTISPKANYVIKLNEDVKAISEVIKTSDNVAEKNYISSKYANSFGDEITLPFNNLFNSTTSRFVSNDGKLIFFILNGKIYCYKNEAYNLTEINTKSITEDNITKIIALENFVFVISSIEPFISTYIVDGDIVKPVKNNISSSEKYSELTSMQQIDIAVTNGGVVMLGVITQNGNGLTIYLNYSEENGFTESGNLTNSRNFNYVLAMNKNHFCDGRIIYLKEGETSASCRIVTHSANQTETDVYSSLAYTLVNNASKIYVKNRAIISEKTSSQKVVIIYYPQMYEYELPLISDELQDYISPDLNYIIQKKANNEYNIYNLVGYDTPEEFTNKISALVDTSKILDFEFLHDTILIFLDDEDKKIVAFNFNLNKTQIENVSNTDNSYIVKYEKYNKLGGNQEMVKFTFSSQVNL